MVLKRPLLFLSLPSLALILGLVWYRRKKSVQCDTGGGNIINNKQKNNNKATTTKINNNKNSTTTNSNLNDEILLDNPKKIMHSYSLTITNKNNVNLTDLSETKLLGKSAPIDIIPRIIRPIRKTIDTNINDNMKNNEDIPYEPIISLEEDEDFESVSPIDLPGSIDERKRFIFRERKIKPEEEPIIIKASMNAKVSPKNSFIENKYTEECIEENQSRDSANHSPIERNILSEKDEDSVNNDDDIRDDVDDDDDDNHPQQTSSPPLSLCSLRSNDSGKGSSPPHSEATPTISYEFLLPQNLVGHIIGRKGSYVNQIKSKTGANVVVRKCVQSNRMKVCSIDGTQTDVDAALIMIRNKLPEKRYPQLTMQRVYYSTNAIPLETIDSGCLRLNLIEGINNDVIISSIMSGGHLFFQQPLHPSYPSLNILQTCMSHSYTLNESPTLPDITDDAICVAPIEGSWYRVQIVSHNPETLSCLCKYLDFGGYCSVLSTELRQIRTDFMTVPFQSIECLLSNIKPSGGAWAPEAAEVLGQLTQGIILQAQVAGYSSDGLPEVYLYASLGPDDVIYVNKELVARGFAEWTEDYQTTA